MESVFSGLVTPTKRLHDVGEEEGEEENDDDEENTIVHTVSVYDGDRCKR